MFGVESERTVYEFGKKKENYCAVFTKSIKRTREIRKFQVADLKLTKGRLKKIANKQLRNVQKNVMRVQSCCFANINRLLFCGSPCRRRRCCLSSPLL